MGWKKLTAEVKERLMKKRKFQKQTLKTKVLLVITAVCVPVLILFFWMNFFSIQKIQNQIYENNQNLLRSNVNQLDAELNKISEYLLNESTNDQQMNLFSSLDPVKSYNGAILYTRKFYEDIHMFNYIGGVACYSPKNGKLVYNFTDQSKSFQQRMQVLDYVKEHWEDCYQNSLHFQTCFMDEIPVLLYCVGNEDMFFFAWTDYGTLLSPFSQEQMVGNSEFCFSTKEGTLLTELPEKLQNLNFSGKTGGYYFSGAGNAYLITGVDSEKGDFRMMSVVNRRNLLGVFYIIRILGILAILFFGMILVPFLLRFLQKCIFQPVESLEKGIRKIEKGDLEVQIPNTDTSEELHHLIESFNSMVSQIRTLKIQTYEDALEKQKLELDYMQLQIEPHFYLNALNLLNTMAQAEDVELIGELTENLSLYLRYIVGSRNGKTTILEESRHIAHYLKIMEIRFGESFRYIQEIDERAEQLVIPPLAVQMLIENSMKYAFDIYGETEIRLKIFMEGPDLYILAEDNGKGYPEKVRKDFADEIPPQDGHIGLWNIKKRLEQMYPGRVSFRISNREPSGARTEIRIKGVGKNEFTSCG